jgi:Uncharacterised nucleotidyltransferase
MATSGHAPAGPLGDVLRTLCDPRREAADAIRQLDAWPPQQIGDLLQLVIENKQVCLLADQLACSGLDQHLSPAMRRFLASTLRANQYKTAVHRAEAVRITGTLADRGVTAAVLNGLATETWLYGGRGTRQFSDIDLLVSADALTVTREILAGLGYSEAGRSASSCGRITRDSLVPRISVDLTSTLAHSPAPEAARQSLSRTSLRLVPGHGPLPVLADRDALLHALGRVAARPRWTTLADALRCSCAVALHTAIGGDAVPGLAYAGWSRLREMWPELSRDPASVTGLAHPADAEPRW